MKRIKKAYLVSIVVWIAFFFFWLDLVCFILYL
jgi:hypothetical protein